MSDILIKNMEMPKNCAVCPLRVDGLHTFQCMRLLGRAYTYELAEQRQEGCPLVEVKPHGELKDFNDILTIFDKVIHDVDDETNALLCDLLVQIQYAPTVLEASNSDEDYRQMVERDCGGCQKNHNGFCDYFNEPTDDAYLVDCPCKVEASK